MNVTTHGLRLITLGGLQVEMDGRPIDHFDTDKTRALLVYLAIENDRPQRRSHLAGLLWSDQPEAQALHSLRQTLSSLRKALGDAAAPVPYLLSERDTLRANPAAPCRVDALDLRAALDAAFCHYQRRDQGGRINPRRLLQALTLYTGPFLAHFDLKGSPLFDEWLVIQREEIDRRMLESLALLCEFHERRGEYALARQTAQAILTIAPWDESAHEQLMRLYALDHQWTAAQNQYRALRRFLEEELGAEPAPSAEALFARIRRRAPDAADAFLRFPPPAGVLPPDLTPFVGCETALDQLADHIADPSCRLLTLLGTGGIGKTRLALQCARQQVGVFTHGVFFVALAALTSVDQVYATLADALTLPLTEQSDPRTLLFNYLSQKNVLLVLDNYEQLLDDPAAVTFLQDLMACAPGVMLLVTSRERLLLQEEWVYPLAGLSIPPQDAPEDMSVQAYDALELFRRRACQARSDFTFSPASLSAAARICRLLEGLPLGIELAAAAVWHQPVERIADQIAAHCNALAAPAANVQPRHRSLWAAFDVSWRLLTPAEQAVFCRLAVFRGGFTPEAARLAAAAPPEILSALVDQSLLRLESDGRYALHEALRQYALEKLACDGCLESSRAAHAAYYVDLLARLRPALVSAEQETALDLLQKELGNARQAWEWAIAQLRTADLSQGLDALYEFFNTRSRFNEGIAWFEPALAAFNDSALAVQDARALSMLRGRLLARIGALAYFARRPELARASLEQAQEIFSAPPVAAAELAFCRVHLGGVYLRAKQFAPAQACGQQNLDYFRAVGDRSGETRALYLLGLIADRQGKLDEAKQYVTGAAGVARQIDDRRRLMAPLNMLGDLACAEGDYTAAEDYFNQSLSIARALQDRFYQAIVLNNLATAYHCGHRLDAAAPVYAESLAICREIGDQDGEAMALNNLAEIAVAQGAFSHAVKLSNQALAIARRIGEEWTAIACLNNLGEAAAGLGDFAAALDAFHAAIRGAWAIRAVDQAARFAVNLGCCRLAQGSRQEALDLLRAALAHPATEHDARRKAIAALQDLGEPTAVPADADALERVLARLVL